MALLRLHRGGTADVHDLSKEKHISRFYRIHREHHSCWDVAHTVLHLHNQTFDIWLHLLGALFFGAVAVQWLWSFLSTELTFACDSWTPYVFISFYFLGCIACFAFSAVFHTACMFPPPRFYVYRALDLTGVLCGSGMSGLLLMFFSFTAQPTFQFGYCATTICFFLLALRELWVGQQNKPRSKAVLFVFYSFMVLGVLHHAWATGDWIVFNGVLETTLWYSIGLFFYVTRIPERMFHGTFDLVGKSHQLWHLFTLVGACRFFYQAALPAILESGACSVQPTDLFHSERGGGCGQRKHDGCGYLIE